jgi:hypothetical protein
MLLPFAKLGLPFCTIKIIPIISAILTGYLLLRKSPFNRITKVCVLFSTTFLYYMPVIARPYSLMPLLITIISILNKNKEKYPILYGVILAMLANTHILMLPLAGMLFLYNYENEFVYNRKKWSKEEKKKIYIGIVIAGLGMLFMAIQAILGYVYSTVKYSDLSGTIFYKTITVFQRIIYFVVGVKYVKKTCILVVLASIIFILHSIFISPKHGVIFLMSFLCFLFVHVFIWSAVLNQRAGIAFLLIYYYAWNYRYDVKNENKNKIYFALSKTVTVILFLMSALAIPNTYEIIKTDIERPYCTGKEVANYIKENINEGAVFLSNNSSYNAPIIAYLDNDNYEFYEVFEERNYSFKTWDTVMVKDITSYDKAISKHEGKEMYILEHLYKYDSLDEFLEENPGIESNAELIFQTSGNGVVGEYYLWKVTN